MLATKSANARTLGESFERHDKTISEQFLPDQSERCESEKTNEVIFEEHLIDVMISRLTKITYHSISKDPEPQEKQSSWFETIGNIFDVEFSEKERKNFEEEEICRLLQPHLQHLLSRTVPQIRMPQVFISGGQYKTPSPSRRRRSISTPTTPREGWSSLILPRAQQGKTIVITNRATIPHNESISSRRQENFNLTPLGISRAEPRELVRHKTMDELWANLRGEKERRPIIRSSTYPELQAYPTGQAMLSRIPTPKRQIKSRIPTRVQGTSHRPIKYKQSYKTPFQDYLPDPFTLNELLAEPRYKKEGLGKLRPKRLIMKEMKYTKPTVTEEESRLLDEALGLPIQSRRPTYIQQRSPQKRFSTEPYVPVRIQRSPRRGTIQRSPRRGIIQRSPRRRISAVPRIPVIAERTPYRRHVPVEVRPTRHGHYVTPRMTVKERTRPRRQVNFVDAHPTYISPRESERKWRVKVVHPDWLSTKHTRASSARTAAIRQKMKDLEAMKNRRMQAIPRRVLPPDLARRMAQREINLRHKYKTPHQRRLPDPYTLKELLVEPRYKIENRGKLRPKRLFMEDIEYTRPTVSEEESRLLDEALGFERSYRHPDLSPYTRPRLSDRHIHQSDRERNSIGARARNLLMRQRLDKAAFDAQIERLRQRAYEQEGRRMSSFCDILD